VSLFEYLPLWNPILWVIAMKSRFGIRIAMMLLMVLPCGMTAQETRPNFIFILTDDHNYRSLGCTGNSIVQTPHIDRLAEDGILFSNAHITSAICTPSRVSIFLSQFERKHGVNFNSGTSVSTTAWGNAYPVLLRRAGYYTGYIGKNHAPVGRGGYESGLMEESFDYWYAGHGHLRFYPKEVHAIFKGAGADTQVEVLQEGVLDFLSENDYSLEGALHFLSSRPEDQPFCLSLCFNLPHGAGTGSMQMRESDPELYKTAYRDMEIPLPDNYVSKKDIKSPKLPFELHHAGDRQDSYNYADEPEAAIERITRRYQTITGIDALVGKLRAKLRQLGLDQNTVLIFSSDHGLFTGEQGLGGKAFCYEQVTHVPMIIYSPLKVDQSNRVNSEALVQSIDIAPTMLEMAGVKCPDSYQGKSLLGLIRGEVAGVREYVFTENLWSTHFGNPRCESVQDQRWKYIRYYENNNLSARDLIRTANEMEMPVNQMLYGVHDPQMATYRSYIESPLQGEKPVYEELYDLEIDPAELHNLAGFSEYEDRLKELRKVWEREIRIARGEGKAQVLRYTVESRLERESIVHE
jgi:arylsulfatase A-like enzyme